jgi:hypothetical protein
VIGWWNRRRHEICFSASRSAKTLKQSLIFIGVVFVVCWTWFTIRQPASAQLLRVAWRLKEALIYIAIISFYSIKKDTTKVWSYWRTSYYRQYPTCSNSANVFVFSTSKRLYILRRRREQKQGWRIQISPTKHTLMGILLV